MTRPSINGWGVQLQGKSQASLLSRFSKVASCCGGAAAIVSTPFTTTGRGAVFLRSQQTFFERVSTQNIRADHLLVPLQVHRTRVEDFQKFGVTIQTYVAFWDTQQSSNKAFVCQGAGNVTDSRILRRARCTVAANFAVSMSFLPMGRGKGNLVLQNSSSVFGSLCNLTFWTLVL
jgi:hypothetical protein